MSGNRTKQLRKECAKRLGRAPKKASGHVSMKMFTVEGKQRGRTILQRVWGYLKPGEKITSDEFRFFKENRITLREHQMLEKVLHIAQKLHPKKTTRSQRRAAKIAQWMSGINLEVTVEC